MANKNYYFKVSGLDPLEILKIQAKTEREANFKIKTTLVDGRKIHDWKLIKVAEDNDVERQ